MKADGEQSSTCHLLSCWFLAWLILLTLKIDVTCASEISVDFQQNTRSYIQEDRTLHNLCCENLRSYRKDFTLHKNINVEVLKVMNTCLPSCCLFAYLVVVA
jgi:abortive infection bacteriophage resistance protein